MDFVWDEEKVVLNLQKHRVSFDEATSVFDDPLAATYYDPVHSDNEDRYVTVGFSSND
ncbi:MAG: BrnT family toxin [Planctomycetia bacterium]